jgi:hypothetical protein
MLIKIRMIMIMFMMLIINSTGAFGDKTTCRRTMKKKFCTRGKKTFFWEDVRPAFSARYRTSSDRKIRLRYLLQHVHRARRRGELTGARAQ